MVCDVEGAGFQVFRFVVLEVGGILFATDAVGFGCR